MSNYIFRSFAGVVVEGDLPACSVCPGCVTLIDCNKELQRQHRVTSETTRDLPSAQAQHLCHTHVRPPTETYSDSHLLAEKRRCTQRSSISTPFCR